MNTSPESIQQLEHQSYDYGYICGIAHERGRLSPIVEDMAGIFAIIAPEDERRPAVLRAEEAYKKYLAITTNAA